MSKKLEEKQRRRLAEERRKKEQRRAHRRRNLVTAAIAILVAGIVIAAVVFQRQAEETTEVGVAESEAGCTEVERHEDQGNDHIEVGQPHDPYAPPAPTSGPHYGGSDGPIQAGFYEDEIPPEGPVHNLEHGQIVIWYQPDAPDDVVTNIEALVEQERFATVALPNSGLQTDKNFVITAWTRSQECDEVSQEVVDAFRTKFQGVTGPEGSLTPRFKG